MSISIDTSIVLCGPAGQGIQTAEKLLAAIFKKAGYHLFATKEYMSRIRGGSNSISIRVSSIPVQAMIDRIDILIPLNRDALKHVERRISPKTLILGEKESLLEPGENYSQLFDISFAQLAKEVGGKIYTNVIVVGIIAGLFKIEKSLIHSYIKNIFRKKETSIIEGNMKAIDKGIEISPGIASNFNIQIDTKTDPNIKDQIIINGAEAVSMGAVAGGCRFIASYPMSPSTAVLTFLAQHAKEFNILAEQVEDEIAAINMALGASYAGTRSMVTTSGGGFALMAEGLSLAGIIETPVVIHLAQRPGPATGLPTRTEQGDLLFSLYAGHGEFPRAIFAPGTLKDGFNLTQKAFNLADQYQIPVFILTDQYYVDSYYNIPKFDLSDVKNHNYITKTTVDYKRYALTENGISPRGIPGYGDGLVVVDSDEHDEEGHITENHDVRIKMVDKRLKKMDALIQKAIPPEWIGPQDAETLVICWGSTALILTEALQYMGKTIALLYFKQVFPLSSKSSNLIRKTKNLIIVENNATSQFAQILKNQLNIDIPVKILKYNGLAFSVEELVNRLTEVIR